MKAGEMTKHKVSELEGSLLDAAVAMAEGYKRLGPMGCSTPNQEGRPFCRSGCNDWWMTPDGHPMCGPCYGIPYAYSSEWERGGPIIDRDRILFSETLGGDIGAMLSAWNVEFDGVGPKHLVSAMRAYAASKLGKEVELP